MTTTDDGFYDDDPRDEMITLGDLEQSLDDAAHVMTLERQASISREMLEHRPRHNVEAERAVCMAVLVFGGDAVDAMLDEGLREEDFVTRSLRSIFAAARWLRRGGGHIDTIHVVDELARRGETEDVGGFAFVASLEASSVGVSIQSARMSARLVIEKARLRSMVITLDGLKTRALVGEHVDSLCEQAISMLGSLSRGNASEPKAIDRVVDDVVKSTPMLGGTKRGTPTCWSDVNRMFQLSPGNLIVIAARPSMGKTSMLLNLLSFFALKRNEPAALFSFEMSATEVASNIVQAEARVSLRKHHGVGMDLSRVADVTGRLSEAPLTIDDVCPPTLHDVCSRARRLHARQPQAIIGVDYLQLMGGSTSTENRATEVGEISKGLKALARELDLPVVALSQLNRGSEARADKRPMMSDLRESGAIEQDADIIAMIYRHEYYLRDKTPEDLRNVAEVIVTKNRHGPTGTAELRWTGEITRFDNLERGTTT